MNRKTNRLGLALVILATGGGCSSSSTGTGSGPDPAISLALSGTSATIIQGTSHQVTASLTRSGGYSGVVAFAVDGAPAGVTGAVGAPTTTGTTTTATITVSVANATAPGTYNLTVRASGSGVSEASATFAITVQAAPTGTFTLTATPTAVSVAQGTNATTSIAITRTGGFAGAVALTVTGAPSGLSTGFAPASATGTSSTLTVTAAANLAAGSHTLTVRGAAEGQADRTVTIQVSVTQPSGSNEVALDLTGCGQRPAWLAVQDGSGPWSVVTPTGNVYRFTVAGNRGAIAYPFATTFQIHHLSRAELANARGYFCGTSDQTKIVNGTVAGLGNNDFAQIWLGGGAGSVSHPNTAFSITQVRSGSHALTGWRHNTLAEILGTPGNPDRGFIRRGVDMADNGSVGVIDFEGSESFAPATAAISIAGHRTGGSLSHTMGYYTGSSCLFSALYSSAAPSTSSMTASGFPASRQQAGDFHFLTVTELMDLGIQPTGYSGTRVIQQAFRVLGDRTVTLPPVLPRPTVTSLAGSYRRLQAVIDLPGAYQRLLNLSYNQTGSPRTVSLSATPGWFGSGTVTLAMPDLSGLPGWNAAWVPPAAATGTWAVQATGTNLTGPIVCEEGAFIIQAAELGAF